MKKAVLCRCRHSVLNERPSSRFINHLDTRINRLILPLRQLTGETIPKLAALRKVLEKAKAFEQIIKIGSGSVGSSGWRVKLTTQTTPLPPR